MQMKWLLLKNGKKTELGISGRKAEKTEHPKPGGSTGTEA